MKNMNKAKKSIETLPQYQTNTPIVIQKHKPKSGPPYRRQVFIHGPKLHEKNQLLNLEYSWC